MVMRRKNSGKSLTAPFAVLDIEAAKLVGGEWQSSWDTFRVAQFVTSAGVEVKCETPAQLTREVESFQGRVFAHYGGRYDFFFLDEPKTLTLSGSGILRAQLGRATLYDSWFLFQMSLLKLGKAVGGKQKHEGKSDAIQHLSDAETAEHCLNDCHVLMQGLNSHREWCSNRGHESPRWPATAGGTAVYCLEAYEPDGVDFLAKEHFDLETWMQQYAAVTGGRVELWRIGRVKGPVHSYDINSSYPQSWCDAPLPLGPWVKVTHETGVAAVYRATVKQSRRFLPVVAPGHVWRYDGEVWLTSEEVARVRECGGTVDVHEGWSCLADSQWFARDFAAQLFKAKQHGDPWAKVGVNSAHGKFGQSIIQTTHVKRGGAWEVDFELGFPSWHQRPLISAFVLARARIRLHVALTALREAGWSAYYVDTDCVHTDCPPELFPGKLGDALGEWKHEGEALEAVYVAPKVYGLRMKDGELKMASKGLPRKQVTWKAMRAAAGGEVVRFNSDDGLVSFRSQKGTWGPRQQHSQRALRAQTGGKKRGYSQTGETGRLSYKDDEACEGGEGGAAALSAGARRAPRRR